MFDIECIIIGDESELMVDKALVVKVKFFRIQR